MAKFTLYWLTGSREVVEGKDAADAMNNAGYGGGAVRALDFYAKGDDHDWEWVAATRKWKPTPNSDFGKQLAAMKS